MNPKEIILKPFEVVAGQDYPDVQQVRHDASDSYSAGWEIDASVSLARREFVGNLVHVNGLRKIIENFKERMFE